MRNISALLLAVLLSASLPACVPTGGGQSSASLGPDTPTIAETVGNAVSTLASRLTSGIDWLWATYTRLDKAGALPGLADLKADIVDVEAAFDRGDLSAALDLWNRARSRVTAITAAVQ